MTSTEKKRKIHRRSKRHDHTFFKHFRFEIFVGSLLAFGIFLLVEDMHIKTVVYQGTLSLFHDLTSLINRIFTSLLGAAEMFETSDIVGSLLIITALTLYANRVRQAAITRYSDLSACPECGEGLHLIHKNIFQRIGAKIFRLKVNRYTCKACDFEGLRIRPLHSKRGH